MLKNKSNLLGVLMSLLLVIPFSSVALASAGNLTIPSQVDDFVELKIAEQNANQPLASSDRLLQVYVGSPDDCCTTKTPIAGSYIAGSRSVRFLPRFNFVEGQEYVIQVRALSEDGKQIQALTPFTIQPENALSTPEITAVYPSGDELPENVLRFYLHFSTPMKPHVAFNYIKLVDEYGNVDDAAFMKFKQELWSEDRTRLTLLMDPGRIKRGVATNTELGPALHEGKSYQLVVDDGWPTANGNQVLPGFSKAFKVTSALRELPNTNSWQINAPTIGTKEPLSINLDRPFDHQLLYKDIKVLSLLGEEIQGTLYIEDSETEWRFQPHNAWAYAKIYIVVDGEFEDVAGNNFKDLMDRSIAVETKDVPYISIPVDLKS
jgi:hypothetical protein